MRVTGGKYKNRQIVCPKGVIRPAMDRMRESMFSILGGNLDGLSFLDIFSGSGVVGIEAASRGASPVTLVEKDFIKKKTILKNISFVESEINLKLTSAELFLKQNKTQYNIIHLDPPFPFKFKLNILKLVDQYGSLKDEGTLMMHYPSEENYPQQIGSLRLYDQRKYGRSLLNFYTKDPISDLTDIENT